MSVPAIPRPGIVNLIAIVSFVLSAVNAQLAGLKNPPQTMNQLLDTLRSQGLAQSVARLRELLGILP